VADQIAGVINQEATIRGEKPSRGNGMKITPWINPVSVRHPLGACQRSYWWWRTTDQVERDPASHLSDAHGCGSIESIAEGNTMGQSDEAWNDVGEQLKTLGTMFKDHYQAYEGEDLTEVVSEDEVKDALRTLGESVRAAFGSIGDAFADPDVRVEARQTAGSFFDALGATFSELGTDISKPVATDEAPSHQDPPGTPSAEASEPEE
jgi:hypothetical protein